MIRFENVSFGYTLRKPVLKDFSLTVHDGEHVVLSGKSGSGKTTVLKLAMGLLKPRSGAVILPENLGISAVFQENRLIPWKSVFENVCLFGRERAASLLKELGLADSADVLPSELSGGMKRRAALARALAHPWELLVLDEAFTGLDGATKEICLKIVRREAEGRMVLMATHDMEEAEALAARKVSL